MPGSRPVFEALAALTEELTLRAGTELRPDILESLHNATAAENSPAAAVAMEHLIANADIAARERMPLCQDCGQATVFLRLGSDFPSGNVLLNDAVAEGVARAYAKGHFRQSVIADGLTGREQFVEKGLPVIHTELVPGDGLNVGVILKGAGSENASRLVMLPPTAHHHEIAEVVIDTVKAGGPSACPPLFISVAIGGSFDTAPVLSKKGFFRSFLETDPNPEVARLAAELLAAVNGLGIGPGGLGGNVTAAGLVVTTAPCHMATMPVAVNIGCNCLRTASGSLDGRAFGPAENREVENGE